MQRFFACPWIFVAGVTGMVGVCPISHVLVIASNDDDEDDDKDDLNDIW